MSVVIVVLVLLALAFLISYARNRQAFAPKSPSTVELNHRLSRVRFMSGSEFEIFVADVMRGLGYRATVLGGSGDQGVDVIATAGNEKLAIQCKNYRKPVGNKPVQEVYAGARHHRCTAAWVVAPEGFTKGGVELARSIGVALHDAQSLREWIRQVDRRESSPATTNSHLADLGKTLDKLDGRKRSSTTLEPHIVDLDEIDRRKRNQAN